MTGNLDHYEAYYAEKLWNLLPEIYRAEDTDKFNSNGPLREMVNRIGAQAAILRRGIDRMWEDQSIETCDDWVIPYIADLLATNLVANLSARGWRLDVAKTIHYRRRKGTMAVLEELAADITGWEVRVVEFFRHLGRTRHRLDPAIGQPAAPDDAIAKLQRAEGLVGTLTHTSIGGTADLRHVYGATKAHSAFDEFFHTADMRRGRGRVGWHDIPRLGVFVWRLRSYGVGPTTPVAVKNCDGWFTFDPTGRDAPLFAKASRTNESFGDQWVSPVEGQLPTPVSQPLFDSQLPPPANPTADEDWIPPGFPLYPESLGVFNTPTPADDGADLVPLGPQGPVQASLVYVRPQRGRFQTSTTKVWAAYHYGFSSEIGAGPYDRRLGRAQPPTPVPTITLPGVDSLATPGAIPVTGTVTFGDSLTHDLSPSGDVAVSVQDSLTVQAANDQRPLIRLAPPVGVSRTEWTFTGNGTDKNTCCLVLDGLFVSGGDVILKGRFTSVTITCCTLDPGSAAPSGKGPFAMSADDRALIPCRLWIECQVNTLIIERSITGPIQTRNGGAVETMKINDSIIQAIPNGQPNPPGADAAMRLSEGEARLSRCTVLGPVAVHRLHASECIFHDAATVDDTQHGCIRFTAWADGSDLPRKYESVRIDAGVPLFVSVDFGNPGYAQLLPTADAAILPPTEPTATPGTILSGAEDSSEMGVFAREQNPIKERSLLIKYQEYMPAGLVPVVVNVT